MQKNEYIVKVVDNIDEFNSAMALRRHEFVEKQGIPEDREFDGNDFSATHFVLKDNENVIGYMRARYFSDFVKAERILLKEEYKSMNLAKQIIDYSFKFCAKKGFKKIVCVCTEPLVCHWEKLGFKEIAEQEHITVGDKKFVPIEFDISGLEKNPLNIKSNFDVLSSCEARLEEAESRVEAEKMKKTIPVLMTNKINKALN